jgi:hypothetical protein
MTHNTPVVAICRVKPSQQQNVYHIQCEQKTKHLITHLRGVRLGPLYFVQILVVLVKQELHHLTGRVNCE